MSVRSFAAVVALLLALVAGPAVGFAQAGNAAVRAPGNSAQIKTKTTKITTKSDSGKTEKTSKVMALVFWLFALMCVGGSLFVITRRNLIAAVMGMVGTFFAIAAIYIMLYAHFLAAIQVLVYAGAIMVLFVFVIMILNRPVDEPWSKQGVWGKGLAIAATAYLLYRLGDVLWSVKVEVAGPGPGKYIDHADFGSTAHVGQVLFQDYIFPFEAVSIVLLVAVVGAIAVARPHKKRETLDADVTSEGGAQ